MVLERNPAYWGGWKEKQIDRIVYELFEDPVVGEQMLRAGELDYAFAGFLADAQLTSLAQLKTLRLDIAPGLTNELIFLNHRHAPIDNLLVRQALAYSFPYEEAIANTWLLVTSNGAFLDKARAYALTDPDTNTAIWTDAFSSLIPLLK